MTKHDGATAPLGGFTAFTRGVGAMTDVGFTHIALQVTDIDRSVAFYAKYAAMQVIHRRSDRESGSEVAWIGDLTRPFVVVLIKSEEVTARLSPFAHLGVGCSSRDDVDRLC